MGRKRVRPRQHFYFCFALLISVAACSLLQDANRERDLDDALAKGNQLLAQNDFDESLKTFRDVWTSARNKPPADLALYSMALVYAHPQNPNRDLQKAAEFFDRTIEEYPSSPLVGQARIWIAVLDDAAKAKQEVEEARQEIERSKQEAEKNRLAIEKSKQEIEKSRLELEKTRQEIEKTKQVIEKSKQIDIEIDQKRRDRGR
jgi:tetratricopeptide (TPR) repeat protein